MQLWPGQASRTMLKDAPREALTVIRRNQYRRILHQVPLFRVPEEIPQRMVSLREPFVVPDSQPVDSPLLLRPVTTAPWIRRLLLFNGNLRRPAKTSKKRRSGQVRSVWGIHVYPEKIRHLESL